MADKTVFVRGRGYTVLNPLVERAIERGIDPNLIRVAPSGKGYIVPAALTKKSTDPAPDEGEN